MKPQLRTTTASSPPDNSQQPAPSAQAQRPRLHQPHQLRSPRHPRDIMTPTGASNPQSHVNAQGPFLGCCCLHGVHRFGFGQVGVLEDLFAVHRERVFVDVVLLDVVDGAGPCLDRGAVDDDCFDCSADVSGDAGPDHGVGEPSQVTARDAGVPSQPQQRLELDELVRDPLELDRLEVAVLVQQAQHLGDVGVQSIHHSDDIAALVGLRLEVRGHVDAHQQRPDRRPRFGAAARRHLGLQILQHPRALHDADDPKPLLL